MAKGARWLRVKAQTPVVLFLLALIFVGCAQAGSGGGGNDDPGSTPPDFLNPFPVAGVTDGVGGFDMLDGANGITTVTDGSSVYALVTSQLDDGVQIIGF